MRILIVNPFGIGDVLFTTPMIAELKEQYPGAYIGYVCNARAKDILLNNPKVDKVFIYEKDQFRNLSKHSRLLAFRKLLKFLRSIRRGKFDIAFDLSLGQEYGFFLRLIGIRKRIGYNYRRRGKFLTDKIALEGYDTKHMVDYYLDLLPLIGIEPKQKNIEFPVSPADNAWAADFAAEHAVKPGDILVGIAPGGGASWGRDAYRKQWPAQRFAALANEITARFGARIVLLGDGSETALCNQVASLIRSEPIIACGRTTVSRYAALLKLCRLIICNDGGPLHLAVSQGVRTISIFGPVDPAVYGPYPPGAGNVVIRKGLDCQPCYHRFKLKACSHGRCLSDLEMREIMGAAESFLGGEVGGA
ncbi:MAG: glycosyltransferase family 9 protein [Candidatus Omnitrophota bacterium]